jgi:hypothetical protein
VRWFIGYRFWCALAQLVLLALSHTARACDPDCIAACGRDPQQEQLDSLLNPLVVGICNDPRVYIDVDGCNALP